ncbi:MAG: AcrR family transcriptional regulator [Flavobacteriales bacterium]|jgi:AcrR family transcriptional regulator
MGRNAVDKKRIKDPLKREKWISELSPAFFEHGIKKLNAEQVAETLNKSKATVYKHFDSHREIVLLVMQTKLLSLQGFQPILANEAKTYPDRYVEAVDFISTHLGEVSNVFLSDLKAIYPDLWDLIHAFKTFAMQCLRSFYQAGAKDGVFQDLNPDLLVLSDELFFDVLTDADYLSEKGLTMQVAFTDYFKMRFHGILR